MYPFAPVSLALRSGDTGKSQLSVTDDRELELTVTCTNGGRYDIGEGNFAAPTVADDTLSIWTPPSTIDFELVSLMFE